jgi:hypothetical protein
MKRVGGIVYVILVTGLDLHRRFRTDFLARWFCDCIERWLNPENGFVSFPRKLKPLPSLREDIPFQTH